MPCDLYPGLTCDLVRQLQQEKRKLRQEMDELRRDKEQQARQNQELKQELGALRTQLEDTEWGLCQKSGQ